MFSGGPSCRAWSVC